MTSNHKLTAVLRGRTITSVSAAPGTLVIGFDDGSIMSLQLGKAGPVNRTTGGTVDKVQQQDGTLVLITTDNSQLTISLAEETSSVIVRDLGGVLEDAD